MPVTSLTPTDYIIVSRFLTGVGQKTNRENNRLRKKTNRENNRLRKKTNREKEQQNKKENKDREEKNNRLRTKTKREKEGNNRTRKNNKNIIFWSRQNRRKLLLTKRRLETSFRNDKKEFFREMIFQLKCFSFENWFSIAITNNFSSSGLVVIVNPSGGFW
jgi:DNA anti-recombination protein RmuC